MTNRLRNEAVVLAPHSAAENRFWSTLAEVGLTPTLLRPDDFRDVVRHGIGLTDLAKTVSGPDAALSREHFDRDGLREKVGRFGPRFVAFTGKRAAQEFLRLKVTYGRQPETVGHGRLFVVPSTSGAARGF